MNDTHHSLCPQLKQPDKAAAAAHTYFQANPEHVEMGQNLEQYKDLQGVKEDHFVDREARPHQVGQDLFFLFFYQTSQDVRIDKIFCWCPKACPFFPD